MSLDPIAPPAFEIDPKNPPDLKPLTATGASMNISGASTFDEKVDALTK